MKTTFFMEQHIGHRAYYENLRRGVERISGLDPLWVEVTYTNDDGRQAELPFLPASLRGSLTGRSQVLAGLKYPADVLFFNTQVPAVLAGRAVKQPYVLATDITPIQYDEMAEGYGHQREKIPFVAGWKHRANVRLLRGADRLLPWSSWTGKSLVEDYGVDPSLVEVIPPGVDLDFWQPDPAQRDSNMVRILFVGGDFERKGGHILLEAFRALPPGKAELVLVTSSNVLPAPGIEVHRNMKPNTRELLALYQSCDIFALPTRAEAFGIAAVEASAVGLPVIASGIGGLTDIVADHTSGFLIDVDDVTALVERLCQLLIDQSQRDRLGRAARQRAESNFNSQRNAARIVEILTETIQQKQAV